MTLPFFIRKYLVDHRTMENLAERASIAVFFRGRYYALKLESEKPEHEVIALQRCLRSLGWDAKLRRRKDG